MKTPTTLTLSLTLALLPSLGCDNGESAAHDREAARGLELDLSRVDLDADSSVAAPLATQRLELATPLAAKKIVKSTTPAQLEKWVRWVGEQPYAAGPLGDLTGDLCQSNQSGGTWYLAGTSGGPVTRSCTIPADTKLVFPLVNYWEAVPDSAYPTPEQRAAAIAGGEEFASWVFANTCSLTARLDGVDLYTPAQLEDTWVEKFDLFDVDLPNDPDNFADYFGLVDVVVPTMGAGYYGHLAPLTPGDHVLEFGGSLCWEGEVVFTTSTTFNLHVE